MLSVTFILWSVVRRDHEARDDFVRRLDAREFDAIVLFDRPEARSTSSDVRWWYDTQDFGREIVDAIKHDSPCVHGWRRLDLRAESGAASEVPVQSGDLAMTRARAMLSRLPGRNEVAYAVAAMALASAAAVVVLETWRAYFNAPFAYRDDSILNLMLVKSVLENSWYLENSRLGAPLGQELYDFPVANGDHLNVVLFRILGLVTDEPAAVLNLFYLLTFPLVALTAFLVMRRLGISAAGALVCSVLYALLPYHFLRGETHVFLSAYYAVPFAAYLIVAVLTGEPLFARRSGTRRGVLAFASARTLATLGMCLVVAASSGSFYYAAFSILLLGAATLLRFGVTRRLRALATGGGVRGDPLRAQRVATPRPRSRMSSDTVAIRKWVTASRSRASTTAFGSRSSSFHSTADRFEPFANAGGGPATVGRPRPGSTSRRPRLQLSGRCGPLGFLGLIGVTLASAIGGAGRRPPPVLVAAGVAAILAFLIATMGGISSLIGLVYPQLRAWNRLSIFIAFFALIAVAIALDRIGRLLSPRRGGRTIFAVVLLRGSRTRHPRPDERAVGTGVRRDGGAVRT